MVQGLRRRFCLRGYARTLAVAAMAGMAGLTGCGESAERPGPDAPNSTLELPQSAGRDLGWPEVIGAADYQVQAWSGLRLLFSERAPSPQLESTPSLERTLALFPDAVLRVEARGADGQTLGEPMEIAVESARRAGP